MAQLVSGTSYTFNTLAPALLGASHKNVKLLSILHYDDARAVENVDLKYRQVLPLLPPGTPNDVSSSIFYRFINEDGQKFLMSNYWIDATSITEVAYVTITVKFDRATVSDITSIRDALTSKGLTGYKIITG
jgi:hypothetical protein